MDFKEIANLLASLTIEQINIIEKMIADLNARDQKLQKLNKE